MSVTNDVNAILIDGIPSGNEYTADLVPVITELVEEAKNLEQQLEDKQNELTATKRDLMALSEQIMNMARKQGVSNSAGFAGEPQKTAKQKVAETRSILSNLDFSNGGAN